MNWLLVTCKVPVRFAQTAVVNLTVCLLCSARADSKMLLSKDRDLESPAMVKQKGEQMTWESWTRMLSCSSSFKGQWVA